METIGRIYSIGEEDVFFASINIAIKYLEKRWGCQGNPKRVRHGILNPHVSFEDGGEYHKYERDGHEAVIRGHYIVNSEEQIEAFISLGLLKK